MNIRERINETKKPRKANCELLGDVFFRRLSIDESERFGPLETKEHNLAVIQAASVDEDGKPVWASVEDLKKEPTAVFNALLAAYVELNHSPATAGTNGKTA